MGLKDLLTKDFKIGSHHHHWQEPFFYRIRLRNDLWQRIVLVLGAWMIGTGVVFLVTSGNQNPPGPGVCIGLGAVFGLGPAMLVLFFREHLTSGAVWLYGDHIRFQQMAVGLGQFLIWAEWSYPQIDRALFISSERLGKPFHVILLKIGSEWQMLGLPKKKLKEVRQFLEQAVSDLGPGKSIPQELCQGISWGLPIATAVAGFAVLVTGVLMAPDRPGNRQRDRPEFAQQQPDLWQQPNPIMPDPLGKLPPAGRANQENSPTPRNDSPDAAPVSPQFPGFPGGFGAGGVRPFPVPGQGNNEANLTDVVRTELVGGSGGSVFQKYSTLGKPVVAIGYRLGEWAGKPRIAELIPLYDRASANPDGQDVVIAREGYVLTGLQVEADDLVNAVAFIFAKVSPEGSIDAKETYTSPWVGTPSGADKKRLGSSDSKVIGFHGRGAAVLDAIGLVLAR